MENFRIAQLIFHKIELDNHSLKISKTKWDAYFD